MHRVFVYGTLKRGFANDISCVVRAHCLGRYSTAEAYPLVVGGKWFSPYLIDEPESGCRVFGEVFELDDQGLEKLDQMEGTHLPGGYRRICIAVESEGAADPFDAWTYVKDRAAIEGIHTEPMEEYPLDPRYVVPAKRTSGF